MTQRCLVLLAALTACTGTGTDTDAIPSPTEGDGIVFKGPMVPGATLTATLLDGALQATEVQSSTTIDDLSGRFAIALEDRGIVLLTATGLTYDEAKAELGAVPTTLSGFGQAEQDAPALQLNLLTDLSQPLVASLVAEGLSFEEATREAEQDLAVGMQLGSEGPPRRGAETMIYGRGYDQAWLLAASAVVSQVGVLLEAQGTGDRTSFLAEVRESLATEQSLSEAQVALIAQAESTLDPALVEVGLRAYLADLDQRPTLPDIDTVLDTDDDDVDNQEDVCPFVSDPDQTLHEGGTWGEACDTRLTTLAFGGGFGCGVDATTGALRCWEDATGLRGGVPPHPREFPVSTAAPWGEDAGLEGPFTELGMAEDVVCGTRDEEIVCWTPEGVHTVAGAYHTLTVTQALVCALDDAGDAQCTNTSGEPVAELEGPFVDLSAYGALGYCAVDQAGGVTCRTCTDAGGVSCVDGAGAEASPGGMPTAGVVRVGGAIRGDGSACAVLSDGSGTCFGNGRAALPDDRTDLVDLVVSEEQVCASLTDGEVECFLPQDTCDVRVDGDDERPRRLTELSVDGCVLCGVDEDGFGHCGPRFWYRR